MFSSEVFNGVFRNDGDTWLFSVWWVFFLTCVCYIIAIIVDTTLESIGIWKEFWLVVMLPPVCGEVFLWKKINCIRTFDCKWRRLIWNWLEWLNDTMIVMMMMIIHVKAFWLTKLKCPRRSSYKQVWIQELKHFHQDLISLHLLAQLLSVLALCAFFCGRFSLCRQTFPRSWQQPQGYFYKLAILT